MKLGELKAELKQHGIRVVGTLRNDSGNGGVVIFFSSDPHITFPFRPKNIYPLPMKTADDGERVNKEKAEAIKRALLPVDDDDIDLAASAEK